MLLKQASYDRMNDVYRPFPLKSAENHCEDWNASFHDVRESNAALMKGIENERLYI
jgi:hypothetical protein